MKDKHSSTQPVVVVGGGLAGLTAALRLAQNGGNVVLYEQGATVGGRARSSVIEGNIVNIGPHALYKGTTGYAFLQEMGIAITGGVPKPAQGIVVHEGKQYRLPIKPMQMLFSPLFSWKAKMQIARWFSKVGKTNARDIHQYSVREWLDEDIQNPTARAFIEMLLRLSTYTHCPEQLSAGAALAAVQIGQKEGVLYIDGGWQSLVDALHDTAVAKGVTIHTGVKVQALTPCAEGVELHIDGQKVIASAVVLALPLQAASLLLKRSHNESLQHRASTALPVQAACLDIVLRRLPQPRTVFALGLTEPTYYSVHSGVAKLACNGAAVVHLAKYVSPLQQYDNAANRRELEAMMDVLQPGWRNELIESRFLPSIPVASAMDTSTARGWQGRAHMDSTGIQGVFLAGDWVGEEGFLADTSITSAVRAADAVHQYCQQHRRVQRDTYAGV